MYKEDFLISGRSHQEPDRVVVHAMAEYVNGIYGIDFLKSIGLSAHIFVCPDGDIIRGRQDNQGAYHAAIYNLNSLGIEFLVDGDHDYSSFVETIKNPYLTDIQYSEGMKFVRDKWVRERGILRYDRHSDLSPGRKVDPGDGFPWLKFLKDIGVTI